MDGDFSTQDDKRIFISRFSSGTWGTPELWRGAQGPAEAVQVLDSGDHTLLLWKQDDVQFFVPDLDASPSWLAPAPPCGT
ncbi:MAG: hypothetical protein QM757_26235 [Paludibaculum sp.]